MVFELPLVDAEIQSEDDTCYYGPRPLMTVDELPHHDMVSVLSLTGGKRFFGLRRIANLDGEEFMRVLGHVQNVVHVSATWSRPL